VREASGASSDAAAIGTTLANEVLDAGARPILEALYAEGHAKI